MQRKIILFIIILFVLSSAYLLAVGQKFGNENFSQNWWAVYFTDPKSGSLDFVIENHDNKNDFHWKVLIDKEIIKEGNVKVENGKTQNIKPDLTNVTSGKIIIEVLSNDEKKEIYKNF